MKLDPIHKLAYNLREAAEELGISLDELRALIYRGAISAYRWGGANRMQFIRADDLRTFIRRGGVAAVPPVVEAATPAPPPCGVYMLYKAGALAYIGRSKAIARRLSNHRHTGREFDDVRIIPCDEKVAAWLEAELIRTLDPPENRMRYQRRAAATVKALRAGGLP